MTQLHIDRLAKLAEHLERGKLAHPVFDFGVYNAGTGGEPICGTAGCALGELPAIYPDQWKWNKYLAVSTKEYYGDVDLSAQNFFAISQDEVSHLFYPEMQKCDLYGGKLLLDDATRYEVAANIRAFIAIKQSRLTIDDAQGEDLH